MTEGGHGMWSRRHAIHAGYVCGLSVQAKCAG